MNANYEFIKKLPKRFTRKELLIIVINNHNYSISKANNIIEYGMITGLLEREKKGVYRKPETIYDQIIRLHEKGLSYKEISLKLSINESRLDEIINKGHSMEDLE